MNQALAVGGKGDIKAADARDAPRQTPSITGFPYDLTNAPKADHP